MARVKSGPHGYKRHKKILKLNKGYYGTKSKLFRRANEQYLKSHWYAYRDHHLQPVDLWYETSQDQPKSQDVG